MSSPHIYGSRRMTPADLPAPVGETNCDGYRESDYDVNYDVFEDDAAPNLPLLKSMQTCSPWPGSPRLVAPPDVHLFCFSCGDVEAQELRLRRKAGKYILLCFKNGQGCWEHHPRPQCEHKDHEGIACKYQAEWEICFGPEKLDRVRTCVAHVAPHLLDVTEHTIYKLDD